MSYPWISGVSGASGPSGSLEDYLRTLGEEAHEHGVAREAQRIASRRRVLSWLFEEVLMLPGTDAAENACAVEHLLSAPAMERLVSLFEFVHCCPAGIKPGERCRVIRVEGKGELRTG